jgi:hypothetical protein
MKEFKYFLECYFNTSTNFMDLNEQTDFFREIESQILLDTLISELEDIIENVKYKETRCIMHECGRPFGKRMTEEFTRYLYARLKNKKPRLTLEQLFNIR